MRGVAIAPLLVLMTLSGCTAPEPGPGADDSSSHDDASVGRVAADDAAQGESGALPTGGAAADAWSLPRMRVGDVAAYEVPSKGSPYTWTYEVKDATTAFDRAGISHGVFVVAATRPSGGTSSDPTYEGFSVSTWRYDPASMSMVTSGNGHRSTGDEIGVKEDWGDLVHDDVTRMNALPLCGFFNALQGTTLKEGDDLLLLGKMKCVSPGPWLDGQEYPFAWVESGDVAGRAVEWFEDTTRRDAHLRLAFSREIPYPVAVEYGADRATLRDFTRGEVAASPPEPMASISIPAYQHLKRGIAGPDDSEAPIPFTLHEAFSAAMESASFTDVQEFMQAHPEARAFQANSQAMRQSPGFPLQDGGTTRLIWMITLVGDDGTLHFCVERAPEDELLPLVGELLGPSYRFGVGTEGCSYGQSGEIPPASSLPDTMPDVVPLMSLWQHYHRMEWEDGGPDHWGFSYSCHEAGCTDPSFSLWAGNSWSWDDDTGDHWAVDRLSFVDGAPAWTSGLKWID